MDGEAPARTGVRIVPIPTDIDSDAPVIARHEIDIHALLVERSRVLWGGTGEGITGLHEWTFDESPTCVHVTTNESFAGEPLAADTVGMQSMLDASLVSWLDHLKAAAESRA